MNSTFVCSPKSYKSEQKMRYRSQLSPQQATELRRVKKQNAERTRRARISDKIVKLHGLALSILGQDTKGSVRTERAEMLNFCYEVLSGLRSLLEENPEVKARLQTIHSDGSTTTTATCQANVPFPNSSITPSFAVAPSSISTLHVSTSQSTSCDSGVHDLRASTSTSLVQPTSPEITSVDPIDCSVQTKTKKSKEIWRPYLHCL